MTFRDDQLAALLACVDEGTFDGAAAALSVTPSAISQRIKALESQVGQVVLVRSVPVEPTAVGEVLLRTARQRAALDSELARTLSRAGVGRGSVLDLPVAVNADSLATWFVEVLETVGEWPDVRLRLFVEDQDHSEQLLRSGVCVGAVTSSSRAVQGCSVVPLGVMRYWPLVRADLWERHNHDLAAVPSMRFNAQDDLQMRVLRGQGVRQPKIEHVVPSAEGFAAAVRAGLAWGMVPEGLAVGSDNVIRIPGLKPLDVPLYWQRWRLTTPGLDRLSDEVRAAAHQLY